MMRKPLELRKKVLHDILSVNVLKMTLKPASNVYFTINPLENNNIEVKLASALSRCFDRKMCQNIFRAKMPKHEETDDSIRQKGKYV